MSPGFSKSESKALLIRDMNHMRSSHVTSDCVTPCSSRGAFIHNSHFENSVQSRNKYHKDKMKSKFKSAKSFEERTKDAAQIKHEE